MRAVATARYCSCFHYLASLLDRSPHTYKQNIQRRLWWDTASRSCAGRLKALFPEGLTDGEHAATALLRGPRATLSGNLTDIPFLPGCWRLYWGDGSRSVAERWVLGPVPPRNGREPNAAASLPPNAPASKNLVAESDATGEIAGSQSP